MQNMNCEQGSPHLIKRKEIYEDVMNLYSNFSKLSTEFPFRVAFDDENAVDSGGVSRDMFSGFWNVVFKKQFDGPGSLIPATHPDVNMDDFPILGKILSHGYISCGFLPVHISFPVLAAVLLGPTVSIDEKILRKSLLDHFNYHDASVLRRAFQYVDGEYPSELQSSLLSLVGAYGCRKIPTPVNLSSLITTIAKHEFLVKPVGAILAMHNGIPQEHRAFWAKTSIKLLLNVYNASNATASAVLNIIREPHCKNNSEESAYNYLIQYVGNLREDGLRNFLRFVTGSSALVVDDLFVNFNALDGIARRPIAHTCSCTLDLPTTYSTFLEFSHDFNELLSSELSWIMDAM